MNLPVANAEASARRAAARGLRVKRPLGIAECATKYRRLAQTEASEHGKWDNDRTPYLIAIMGALEETHPAEEVILLKPAQIGGTVCGQNWLAWTLLESPATCIVVMPTEKMGLRWVRSKFRPMVRATPALRRIVSFGQRRRNSNSGDDDSTMQQIRCGNSVIFVASANIGSDLRMDAFRRLLFDELDDFPAELAREGDPVELAMERFKTYNGRRKCFKTSTPTDDSSRIAKEYADSSQGEYYVPCPHCGTMQTLEWERLQYTPDDPKDAAYVCEQGCVIEETHKPDMLRRGEWRHRHPELVASRIGFALNCLYTPLGLGDRWQDNARKYERAKKDPAKLRAFENTRLGKIHRGQNIRLEAADLKRRTFARLLRTVPRGTLALTAGVDVQHDRIEVQIIGWARDERITTIDFEILPGSPTGTEVWQALDAFLLRPIANEFVVPMPIECVLIDAGNWQHEVTNFTRALRHRRIFASKGSSVTTRVPIGRPSMVDVKYRGKVDQRGAELYLVGAHALKNSLFARLRADGELVEERDKKKLAYGPEDLMVRFSNELTDEYFEQLTAEKFDATKGRYVAIRERNEALDTMLLAMAAGMHHSVAVHKFRELDWQRREERFETAKPQAAPVDLGKATVPLRGGSFLPVSAVTESTE